VAGVLRLEIGHAFDMAAGRRGQTLSSSQQFLEAYWHDISRIASADRDSLAYYLQAGRSGAQETFAEAFAVALGGGSSDMEPAAFEANFPQVMTYARESIADPGPAETMATTSRGVPQTTFHRRLARRR
jgi:hypothetical protein